MDTGVWVTATSSLRVVVFRRRRPRSQKMVCVGGIYQAVVTSVTPIE